MRHPILYAEEVWRRQRWIVVFALLYAVSSNFWLLYLNHFRLSPSTPLYLVFVLLAFLLFAGFQINKQRSYVEVEEGGLRVSRVVRTNVIPYSQIRSVRVLPLRSVTADLPRRSITPAMKQLLDRPSLIIKLQGDPAELARLAKALNPAFGHRLVFDSTTAAIPVKDAAAVASELAPHVQVRASVNMGGARRQKRRR